MAGGSANHDRSAVGVCSALDLALAVGRCEVFNSDLKLRIEAYDLFTYPDVVVLCGSVQYFPNRTDTVLNPTVIVEVLLKATRALDQGEKFTWYRSSCVSCIGAWIGH